MAKGLLQERAPARVGSASACDPLRPGFDSRPRRPRRAGRVAPGAWGRRKRYGRARTAARRESGAELTESRAGVEEKGGPGEGRGIIRLDLARSRRPRKEVRVAEQSTVFVILFGLTQVSLPKPYVADPPGCCILIKKYVQQSVATQPRRLLAKLIRICPARQVSATDGGAAITTAATADAVSTAAVCHRLPAGRGRCCQCSNGLGV